MFFKCAMSLLGNWISYNSRSVIKFGFLGCFLLLGWWLFIYLFIAYHWNRKEEEYSVKKNNYRLPLIRHNYFHLDQLLISCGSFPVWFKREVIVKKWGGRWRIRSGIILFTILTIIKNTWKSFTGKYTCILLWETFVPFPVVV